MSRPVWRYVLTLAFLVAACAGEEAALEPEPGQVEPGTAWERVVGGFEEGEVPLDVALQAFALAFGDLPGVTLPEGERSPVNSGSGPVRWVLNHWDELTPEQQAAVNGVLESLLITEESAGSVVLAMTGVPLAQADEQALLGLIDQVEGEIAANLGRDLGIPIELHLAPNLDANAFATALGTDAGGSFFGPIAKCTITITKPGTPYAEQIDNGVASAELTAIIGHEVFHCFQDSLSSTLAETMPRPSWVVEGLAEWAGETVAGGSDLAAWSMWLQAPLISLFKREVSAIGFYSHLQEHGAQVWQAADDIILASNGGSETAYAAAIAAAGPDALATWAPGAYRDPTRAPNWDQDGPGITPEKYPGQTLYAEVGEGTTIEPFAERLAADIWTTSLSAQVVTIAGSGQGMILLPDEAELRLPDALGTVLCTDSGGCTCPEDSPRAGTIFRITEKGETRIGLTGHLEGSNLTVRGWSLDDYCQDEGVENCLVGTWESVSYTAQAQVVLEGTGSGIVLTIDKQGQAMIDFDPSIPIWTRLDYEGSPAVRITQSGQGWFEVDPASDTALVTTGTASGYHIAAQVQLGDELVDASDFSMTGAGFGPGVTLVCEGDTVTWTAPGSVSQYVFARMTTEPEEVPPPPEDGEPLQSPGEGGEGDGATPPVPPPDWGLGLDACAVLTIEEIRAVFPDALDASAEDDISSQLFHQCTYGEAFFLQLTPPTTPAAMGTTAEILELEVLEVDGIGDWAMAFINQPNPDFGTTDNVFMVVAGNGEVTVTFVMWAEIYPDTTEYQGILDLLAKALSRT